MRTTPSSIRPLKRSLALALGALAVAAWACSSTGEQTSTDGGSGTGPAGGGGAARGGSAGLGTVTAGGAGTGASSGSGAVAGSGGAAAGAGATGAVAGSRSSGGATSFGGAAGSSAAGNAGTAGVAGAGAGGTGTATCGALAPPVFSANVRINDDTGNGNQAEVTLATGPGGLAIAAWGDSRSDRTCTFSVTKDGGRTWGRNVAIANVSGQFVGDPAAAIDAGGTLYAVCQEYVNTDTGAGNIRLMTSTDQGTTWSAVRTIQAAPDKPWARGGTTEGTLFVSWLGNPGGLKRSTDRGQTWGATQSLGSIIHGTDIVTSSSGLVHVPYNLDSDRNQLRYLRSVDGGATWEKARDLIADMGSFCFSCNPRQHPIVGAASDPTGQSVAFTWSSTMPGGQGDDDVWLLFSKDGGKTWTKPIRVNDNASASRQFQPWVAVDSCGRVHVAWTDLRNGKNEVWYSRSADPASGFEKNIQITDGRGSANTDFLGDYKGLVVQGSDVLAVWQDTRRDSGDIYFSRAAGAAAP